MFRRICLWDSNYSFSTTPGQEECISSLPILVFLFLNKDAKLLEDMVLYT